MERKNFDQQIRPIFLNQNIFDFSVLTGFNQSKVFSIIHILRICFFHRLESFPM